MAAMIEREPLGEDNVPDLILPTTKARTVVRIEPQCFAQFQNSILPPVDPHSATVPQLKAGLLAS
jgi:hypothetical protein